MRCLDIRNIWTVVEVCEITDASIDNYNLFYQNNLFIFTYTLYISGFTSYHYTACLCWQPQTLFQASLSLLFLLILHLLLLSAFLSSPSFTSFICIYFFFIYLLYLHLILQLLLLSIFLSSLSFN